jgi:cytochrome c peroxidase
MTRGQAWLGVVCLFSGCWQDEALIDDTFTEDDWMFLQTFRPPVPELCPPQLQHDASRCEDAARLGQLLFFDRAVSGPIEYADPFLANDPSSLGNNGEVGKIACADCHDPAAFFIDTRTRPGNLSLGAKGRTRHNAMSTVNVSLKSVVARANCEQDGTDPLECGLVFSWTGKYPTAGEVLQLAGAGAMNSSGERLSQVIRDNDRYRALYLAAFRGVPQICDDTGFCECPPFGVCHAPSPGEGVEEDVFTNVSLAFETYLRHLNSINSPFDRYIATPGVVGRTMPDVVGFGEAERRGLAVFLGKGMCVDCHHGPLLSDLKFHNTGVSQIGPNVIAVDGGYGDEEFPGGFEVPDSRLGEFLTPPLRHVAKTAPYMHAGQYGTLTEVIEFYRRGGDRQGFSGTKDGRIQPLEITDDEARDLETFLRALTGSESSLKTWTPELP